MTNPSRTNSTRQLIYKATQWSDLGPLKKTNPNTWFLFHWVIVSLSRRPCQQLSLPLLGSAIFPHRTISITIYAFNINTFCTRYIFYIVCIYIINYTFVGYVIFPHHTISITIYYEYQYRNCKSNIGNNLAKVETSWSNTHKQLLLKNCIYEYTPNAKTNTRINWKDTSKNILLKLC